MHEEIKYNDEYNIRFSIIIQYKTKQSVGPCVPWCVSMTFDTSSLFRIRSILGGPSNKSIIKDSDVYKSISLFPYSL